MIVHREIHQLGLDILSFQIFLGSRYAPRYSARGVQLSKKSNDIKIASLVNSVEFLEKCFFFVYKKKT